MTSPKFSLANLISGLFFIAVGLIGLSPLLGIAINWSRLWPFLLLLVGAAVCLPPLITNNRSQGKVSLMVGTWLMVLGLYFEVMALTNWTWVTQTQAMETFALALGFWAVWAYDNHRRRYFNLGVLFSSLALAQLVTTNFTSLFLPVLFLFFGIWFLVRKDRKPKDTTAELSMPHIVPPVMIVPDDNSQPASVKIINAVEDALPVTQSKKPAIHTPPAVAHSTTRRKLKKVNPTPPASIDKTV